MRNPCAHDARVRRTARSLRALGYDTTIVAVVSDSVPERLAWHDGIPIVRLAPASPFDLIRRRIRRLRRDRSGVSTGEPAVSGAAARAPATLLRLHRLLRTLDYYRRAIFTLRALRPALVHCNDYNTMWAGIAARFLFGSAVVYDAHEIWADRNGRPELRWWVLACEALFVRCAHRTITTSPAFAEIMARRYRIAPPVVIRNIPETTGVGNGRPDARRDRAVVVYVGGLVRDRGLEQAIAALAEVPDVGLRLIGPGSPDYIQRLTGLADRCGVRDRVERLEPVPPEGVVPALAEADVGLTLIQPVCLNNTISLPNKLFEYLAAGLPVLGSDVPVIADFIHEHGVGLVAAPEDVDDIAAKLALIVEPERNRAYRRAAKLVSGRITWAQEQSRLAGVHRDALARAAATAP